ncbi:MAG TPA: Sbal_3080 family lipoprotein [Rhodocyclaceae bacterium]|nr:Sbal_3080 family lipoprotein [Rhodocyclaceae bacterium]
MTATSPSRGLTLVVAVLLLSLLPACSIRQTVKPVAYTGENQVCVIENPSVRPGFIEAYKRTLIDKGYVVRQLPANASLIECPTTSTYLALWRWDLALYMAYADIKVYGNAKLVGEAIYDSQRGSGNLGKFIDADKKIAELVNQLFPGGARLSAPQQQTLE